MANKLKIKRSAVPGKVPTVADLDLGELAINTYDGKAYMKKNVSGVETVVLLTGAGAGDVLGPASSGDNAIARFDGTSGKIVQNSGATIDDSGNVNVLTTQASGTGANKMPVGTTAQRPGTPSTGMYRMNTTTGEPEWWDANRSQWTPFGDRNYEVELLVVAGGGGGGSRHAGGGGAGGYTNSSKTLNRATGYPIVIGAGGSGGVANSALPASGSNTIALDLTAIGGGGAGQYSENGSFRRDNGLSGGSGGGGANSVGAAGIGGSGTSGQGNAGGSVLVSGNQWAAAGGGGANAAGGNSPNTNTAGAGGAGKQWLNGSYYGGGGGGGGNDTIGTGGAGGIGGGGAGGGGAAPGDVGTSGTANTGGGGGGSRNNSGGNGGSGVVIIRYLGAQRGSGGTVTSAGGYTYHTFTSSGTYTA